MKTILTFLFAVAMVVFVNTANAGVPKSQPEQNVFIQVSNDDIVCNSNIDYHCATINQITFMEKKNVDPAVLEFYSQYEESSILRASKTLELSKAITEASEKFFKKHKYTTNDALERVMKKQFQQSFEIGYTKSIYKNLNLRCNPNLKEDEIYISIDNGLPQRIS